MMSLKATHLIIVDGIMQDPNTRVRAERMMPFIDAGEVLHVDDARLHELADELGLGYGAHHGGAGEFLPVVIFNRFRFDETDEARAARLAQFPKLARYNLAGYNGLDWRGSGTEQWRAETRCVCQPAWQIHTIIGCPFRCAYCGLGHTYNIMMNMEDLVDHLDPYVANAGDQTLFQFDNGTDTACFEPEYGGSELLINYFAHKPGKYLELYVGKSDNVEPFLNLDHRGKTVACWSLSGQTQSTLMEPVTADMEGRIQAMRRMQEAGYPVRVRLSPIVPVRNWRQENREMLRRLLDQVRPDMITMETLRYSDFAGLERDFDLSLLDEEFLQVMRDFQGRKHDPGGEIPDEYRWLMYRFIINEIMDLSPTTPIAFCREARAGWELFAEELATCGQYPDDYVCNCGPFSHPGEARTVIAAG